MSVLVICLFITMLLPYLSKIPVAYAMHKEGGYDNHYPREQQDKLKGFGARALAAHKNSFESMIIFTPACLTAIATHQVTPTLQVLAIAHVVSRFIYHLFYLMNLATLRSTIWFIGIACSFAMMWMCIPQ